MPIPKKRFTIETGENKLLVKDFTTIKGNPVLNFNPTGIFAELLGRWIGGEKPEAYLPEFQDLMNDVLGALFPDLGPLDSILELLGGDDEDGGGGGDDTEGMDCLIAGLSEGSFPAHCIEQWCNDLQAGNIVSLPDGVTCGGISDIYDLVD